MNTPLPPSEALPLAGLAGELRISVGKLMRRMREQVHPNDLTSSQKSVLLRLDRDGLSRSRAPKACGRSRCA